jgi:hypothetical protein
MTNSPKNNSANKDSKVNRKGAIKVKSNVRAGMCKNDLVTAISMPTLGRK